MVARPQAAAALLHVLLHEGQARRQLHRQWQRQARRLGCAVAAGGRLEGVLEQAAGGAILWMGGGWGTAGNTCDDWVTAGLACW